MVMAGLEKKELFIQTTKAILIIILASVFVKEYELIAIVSLFIIFMLFVNFMQLYYIKKEINITPFSTDLLLLVMISIPVLYYSILQDYTFEWYHFILIPIASYAVYIFVFYKRLIKILSELK